LARTRLLNKTIVGPVTAPRGGGVRYCGLRDGLIPAPMMRWRVSNEWLRPSSDRTSGDVT
jgi:hypothetical protein